LLTNSTLAASFWFDFFLAFDNNKIRWKKKTEKDWKTLTFQNGMYDFKDINRFIQRHPGRVDPKDDKSAFTFNLYFDMTVYRVVF